MWSPFEGWYGPNCSPHHSTTTDLTTTIQSSPTLLIRLSGKASNVYERVVSTHKTDLGLNLPTTKRQVRNDPATCRSTSARPFLTYTTFTFPQVGRVIDVPTRGISENNARQDEKPMAITIRRQVLNGIAKGDYVLRGRTQNIPRGSRFGVPQWKVWCA